MQPSFTKFRERLQQREQLLGTFVKLPTTQAIEIFGTVGFDFVVIDQEHAPLDRAQVDLMVLAARAANVAPLVRVSEARTSMVLPALDCGAAGIMFPHVSSVEEAQAVAASCRYLRGNRGFASMSRAGLWGSRTGLDHMRSQDAEVVCIAMIEDMEAVERVADIAAVEGIDAIFIGRGDLTASLGEDPQAKAKVAEATRKIAVATRAADKALMVLASGTADADAMREIGASGLMVASDHNFLRTAAINALREYGRPNPS